MKIFKKIALILVMVLFAVQAWGLTYYDKSDDETTSYETFAAMMSAETFADDDVVDLEGATFLETLTTDGNGSDGHPVVIKGPGVIDGENSRSQCIYINGNDYITVQNLEVKNASINIECNGQTDRISILSNTSSGSTLADFWVDGLSEDLLFDSNTITQGADYTVVIFGGSGTEIVDPVVSNNTFIGQAGGTHTHGFYLRSIDGLVFSGNTITDWTLNNSTQDMLLYFKNLLNTTTFSNNIIGSIGHGNEGFNQIKDVATFSSSGNIISYQSGIGLDVENTTAFLSSGDTISNSGYANLQIYTGTVAYAISELNSSYSATNGVTITAGTGTISDSTISYSGENALYITASTVSASGNVYEYSSNDGVNSNDNSSVLTDIRSISRYNGSVSDLDSGDGWTAHLAGEMNTYSCVGYGNYKSGISHTGSSTGKIINCTFFNNIEATNSNTWGDENGVGIGINSTGNWTIKNNVLVNNGDNLIVTATAIAGTPTLVIDYNSYYSTIGSTQFYWNGHNIDTLSALISNADDDSYTIDAHSITTNPLLTPSGNLFNDSPCVDAGEWIEGVNMEGQADINGKYVHRLPNIGADQKAGSPYNKPYYILK